MSRAMLESLTSLEKWFTASTNRMLKLARGNGEPGHRAGPAQNPVNDQNIGSRLDIGNLIKKDGKNYRRVHWQLNKDAANSTIRKEAQKDSHKIWSYADVEIKENPTTEEAQSVCKSCFEDLKDNMKDV